MRSWATIIAGTFAFRTAAAPAESRGTTCSNPRIRKEWRTLTIDERKKYIAAVKCMMTKPPKFKKEFPIVESRYDDFVTLHVNISLGGKSPDTVKPPGVDGPGGLFVGGHDKINILPWHRYLLSMWEDAITEECGWHTGIPYWNWYWDVPDAGGHFNKSPIWDPDSGFGGNGLPSKKTVIDDLLPPGGFPGGGGPPGFSRGTGGGCVTDGPFKDTKFRIGPFGQMRQNHTHCLTRDINPTMVEKFGGISKVRKAVGAKNFKEFMDQVSRIDSHNLPPGLPGFGKKSGATGSPKASSGHEGHRSGPFPKGAEPKGASGFPKGFPGGAGGFSKGFPGGAGGFPGGFGSGGPGGDPDIHVIAHSAIGGEMLDPLNSLNEPLFYLHHGAIDYYWSVWQERYPKNNLYDLDASSKRDLGEKAGQETVEMGVYARTRTSKEVSDPLNRDGTGVLCFKYDGPTAQDYLSDPPPQAPKGP